MSDLETDLSRLPLRPAPAEWRADILRAARAAAPEPSAAPWWSRWLAPQALALGTAWLLIAVLRLSTPDQTSASWPVGVVQLEAHVRTQEQLVAELLGAASPKPQPPVPHGAVFSRRPTRIA